MSEGCSTLTRGELLLAEICAEIYSDYDRALAYRGAVDFQDSDPPGADDAATGERTIWRRCGESGSISWKTRRRTARGCRKTSCGRWPGRAATGRASAIPIKRSMRLSPPPIPSILRDFIASDEVDWARTAQFRTQRAQHTAPGESADRLVALSIRIGRSASACR